MFDALAASEWGLQSKLLINNIPGIYVRVYGVIFDDVTHLWPMMFHMVQRSECGQKAVVRIYNTSSRSILFEGWRDWVSANRAPHLYPLACVLSWGWYIPDWAISRLSSQHKRAAQQARWLFTSIASPHSLTPTKRNLYARDLTFWLPTTWPTCYYTWHIVYRCNGCVNARHVPYKRSWIKSTWKRVVEQQRIEFVQSSINSSKVVRV